jgi:hypothetical protein
MASEAVYQQPVTVVAPSTTTAPPSGEPQPSLAPMENPPAERTYREADKPEPADAPALNPEPQSDATDENATNLQAPQLFNPGDRTAQRHAAPVWTAVYHKPRANSQPTIQNISWQQVQRDAEGWSSASE